MTREDGIVSQPGGPRRRAAPRVEVLGQSHGPATRGVYRVAEAARERGQPTTWLVGCLCAVLVGA